MSYQVLARKYRPKSFETLIGQEHIVRALTHALEQQRLHHAYLFTGTRGVGKTTLSRILAKALNCVGADGKGGITAHPCGVCDVCVAIDAGRFVDYIEMDAASNRGIDDMLQLLEQAVYAPSNARFKIYMIDEVHMLTGPAFNAMLKTLEEPPEHVKFILATTDPQKIPVTVLSRCLQFNLKQMPPGHIIDHLASTLEQEQIEFDVPALRLLAQGAHGSMRDALSLTDQAISYAAGKVTLEAVQGMLGALDQTYLIRLLDALANQDGAGLLAVADEMAARSLSYSAALQDLGSLLHQVALAQTVPAALADDLPEREAVLRLAGLFDAEEVQLFYQIAVHGRNELNLAPDEYAGFSMTLLRMLAFRPVDEPGVERAVKSKSHAAVVTATAATHTTQRISAAPSAARLSAAPYAASSTVVPISISEPAALPKKRAHGPARAALDAARSLGKPTRAPEPISVKSENVAAPKTVTAEPPWHDDVPQQSTTVASAFVAPVVVPGVVVPESNNLVAAKGNVSSVDASALDWDGNWPLLAASLPLRGVAHQLAQQSELLSCEKENTGVRCHFRIPMDTLLSGASADKLAAALSAHFNQPVQVSTEVGMVQNTANAQTVAAREARQRQAEQAIEADPMVQTLMRDFGATIVPGSIKPI
ncbi:MAG: DNA polymerase III subunit gamma/tau [Herbaspirillum sp.]